MISTKQLGGEQWLVTVESNYRTEHRVQISDADLQRLGLGHTAEELLHASFEFLLERESNTSILRSFELSVISDYFPEYEQEMMRRLN